jgi:SSS family solute:Na+ symporter/sodium/pantothenate symporter
MSDYMPLTALVAFMLASVWLGVLANRAMEGKSFLKGYFLGDRGLGPWAMALTATVQSGGTFMGFPSLIYTYGWVLALWIASYMMVPLCSFGVLGKRIGQLARRTGAVTLPDLLQERFGSVTLGRIASLIIIVFLTINMVSQFKGGAIILKTVMAGSGIMALNENPATTGSVNSAYLIGLAVFTVVVLGYTLYGGFLAAVWTDMFQSVMMFVGVMILLPLTLMRAGGLEQGTQQAITHAGASFAFGPGDKDFLPLGGAVSFFFLWALAGMGQPATLVRHMAFRNTKTIRHATFLLSVYNVFIYIPLLMIFVCARSILPELAAAHRSDEIMPRLAVTVAHPIIAGLILTAPFGAVMATVSAFLVVIASGLARDVYQRWFHPEASERTLQRVTYAMMTLVAVGVAIAGVKPPEFLQQLIVYTGGSLATAFLFPALMTAFWRRATEAGTLAAMLSGPLTMFCLYAVNLFSPTPAFKAYPLFGVDPFVWGLMVSTATGIIFSRLTAPPPEKLVAQFFEVGAS